MRGLRAGLAGLAPFWRANSERSGEFPQGRIHSAPRIELEWVPTGQTVPWASGLMMTATFFIRQTSFPENKAGRPYKGSLLHSDRVFGHKDAMETETRTDKTLHEKAPQSSKFAFILSKKTSKSRGFSIFVGLYNPWKTERAVHGEKFKTARWPEKWKPPGRRGWPRRTAGQRRSAGR